MQGRLPLLFFFFNGTATTEIYTLSLHDALPIFVGALLVGVATAKGIAAVRGLPLAPVDHLQGHVAANFLAPDPFEPDRKSTRLNSSHGYISYAVFCLKKKNKSKPLYAREKAGRL